MKRRVRTFKGMTIVENIIAFTLIITALVIAGTAFYTAGDFLIEARKYNESADIAQEVMESGIKEAIISAYDSSMDESGVRKPFSSNEMKNAMNEMGYEYDNSLGYYVKYPSSGEYKSKEELPDDAYVLIRPLNYDESTKPKFSDWKNQGNFSLSERVYNPTKATSAEIYRLTDDLSNKTPFSTNVIKGTYIYVCVPLDPYGLHLSIQAGDADALKYADYIPLACFISDWEY